MKQFKFKFNKKSQYFTIDDTIEFNGVTGWWSTAIQVADQIQDGDVFDDDDKKRIKTLKLYTIYKQLQTK